MLPDFDEFRDLVASVVRQCGGHMGEGEEIVTITPGLLLAQYPQVPAAPFQATFLRAVALNPDHRGVAFLTPVHPLVRAVLQRVRSRLYDAHAKDRVAIRPVAGTGDGWLFTAVGRLHADDGRVLEEPLVAVFVPRHFDGSPADPSSDEEADTRLLRSRPARSTTDLTKMARQRLSAGFDQARTVAISEAHRRLASRARRLQDQLSAEADRLQHDLDRWHRAEIAEVERRFETGSGTAAVQLSLFADLGHGEFHTLEEAVKIVDEDFARRREGMQRGLAVADIPAPEMVGCLLCVEVDPC